MKRFARKYVEFIRQPDVGPLLAVALFARMPIGMLGFSMLMFLRESLGNFTLAGIAVGINFVAMALAAPVQGRLIDRYGPRKLLYLTGAVQPLALCGVLASAKLGLAFPFLAIASAFAGAFASPITTITRTMWRHLFDTEEDRRTAFALDAVMIELNFVMGPAIMAAILTGIGTTAAFGLAIAVVVAALLVFVNSRGLRYFKPTHGERHLLGPLTEPRLLIVFAATFGEAMCIGLLEVGYPAYGVALAAPAIGGLLLSVNSLGSAIGGAFYGGTHFKSRIERQFAATLALMSVPFFLHVIAPTTFLFACAAFLTGALIAPSIASQSVLVSRLAPAHYATEAFTWSSSCIVAGIGIGEAVGGYLLETRGVRFPFGVGAGLLACMALLALAIPARRGAKAAALTGD